MVGRISYRSLRSFGCLNRGNYKMSCSSHPSAAMTLDKTRICVGLEHYGEFTPWSKADDLLELLAAIGVGFEVDVEGGPCDILLRNTESIIQPVKSTTQSFDTPVILFDSYDGTHLPIPIAREVAKPEVKAYLRSNTFRDAAVYFRQAQGGSYYNHVLSSSMNGLSPDVVHRLADECLEEAIKKIVVCNPILPAMTEQHLNFLEGQLPIEDRSLDVLFNNWDGVSQQLKLLNRQSYGLHSTTTRALFQDEIPSTPNYGIHYILYLAMLSNTKILVSPWGSAGFSKIDFEALLCGTIVVKPECSNIRTLIDIYDPLHGYVQYCSPCCTDLRDLLIYILNNLDEYKAVSREAKEVLQQYYVPSNKVVTSWLSNFRSICEKVLSGNSNSLGDLKVPVASLKG